MKKVLIRYKFILQNHVWQYADPQSAVKRKSLFNSVSTNSGGLFTGKVRWQTDPVNWSKTVRFLPEIK
jgi:hypothetical protein